jgi:hypothetical protein
VWGSEVSLYYEELYAGTTDLVGVYKGEPAIMDFKQSRRLKKKEWVDDYYLQLVAYAEAHNKQYGTNIKSGRMFICTQANEFQSFDIENYDYWTDQWYRKLESNTTSKCCSLRTANVFGTLYKYSKCKQNLKEIINRANCFNLENSA